jgi:hypothetical protein
MSQVSAHLLRSKSCAHQLAPHTLTVRAHFKYELTLQNLMTNTVIAFIIIEAVGLGLRYLINKSAIPISDRLSNSEGKVIGIGQFVFRLGAAFSLILIYFGFILLLLRLLIELGIKPI